MKCLYRRFTGPSWQDATEIRGARGQWLEKRIAFIDTLRNRGHQVEIVKQNPGDSTYRDGDRTTWDDGDLIFLEFASINEKFHERYLDVTRAMLRDRAKDTILILDDPDLFPKKDPFIYKDVWVNAEDPEACAARFGQPCTSFPVYGLQTPQEYSETHNGKAVYYGGSSCSRGRKAAALKVALEDKLDIYGAQKEYKEMTVLEPPKQVDRKNFYRQYGACINFNDNLHKQLKWNTGRKFHSILAGTPTVDESPFMEQEIRDILANPQYRREVWERQSLMVTDAKSRCESLLSSYGL